LGYNINNNFKLVLENLSDNTTVAHAPTTDVQTLQPESGKVWELIKIWIYIPDPVGSSAGSHKITAYYDSSYVSQSGIFSMTSNTGSAILTAWMAFSCTTALPSASTLTYYITNGWHFYCSNDNPIYFAYTNSTDVDQTGNRILKILVKEYNEVL